jgi:hypothetical protein
LPGSDDGIHVPRICISSCHPASRHTAIAVAAYTSAPAAHRRRSRRAAASAANAISAAIASDANNGGTTAIPHTSTGHRCRHTSSTAAAMARTKLSQDNDHTSTWNCLPGTWSGAPNTVMLLTRLVVTATTVITTSSARRRPMR